MNTILKYFNTLEIRHSLGNLICVKIIVFIYIYWCAALYSARLVNNITNPVFAFARTTMQIHVDYFSPGMGKEKTDKILFYHMNDNLPNEPLSFNFWINSTKIIQQCFWLLITKTADILIIMCNHSVGTWLPVNPNCMIKKSQRGQKLMESEMKWNWNKRPRALVSVHEWSSPVNYSRNNESARAASAAGWRRQRMRRTPARASRSAQPISSTLVHIITLKTSAYP